MIAISCSIEHHPVYAFVGKTFGDLFADCAAFCKLLFVFLGPFGDILRRTVNADQGLAVYVIDNLGINMLTAPEHNQPGAVFVPADILSDPQVSSLSASQPLNRHRIMLP
jgi:hypothetical protein